MNIAEMNNDVEFVLPQYIVLPKVENGDIVSALREMSTRLETKAKNVALRKRFDPARKNPDRLEFVNPEWFAVAADVLRQVAEWAKDQPALTKAVAAAPTHAEKAAAAINPVALDVLLSRGAV